MTLPQRGTNPQTREKETADDGSTTETSDEDFDTKQPQPRESQHNPRTRSEESSSSASSSPEPAGKTRQNLPPRPKGVLGRIGGASKPTVSPSKHKLGQIGGTSASARSPKPASKSPEPKSRLSKQPESPPSPRGSNRERADEKREQLKRELEEKSKHGTKKKRKF
ncbi:MAG: hypothetical protein LQ338_002096 [Usnochroma carphineum]|nr:MAG: hypothetical protein LQ338_002096 [Usnochroma carphineum]